MDCTAANIRREFATRRTLWVQVIGLAATVLLLIEAARRAAAAGSVLLVAGVVLIVGCGGALLSGFLAVAVRRASFEAELWRKFGLSAELLQAVDAAGELDETLTEQLDQALRNLRSLAAVSNQADPLELEPDAQSLVEAGERALTAALEALPAAERLGSVGHALADASASLISALAAQRQGDGERQAEALAALRAAAGELA